MAGEFGDLVVSISTDLSELKKGLSEAASQVQDAANAMAIGLTAVTAAMTIGIKSALNYGGEIDRMTKITGLSAETLSRLKYAAEQNDVSFDSLTRSLMLLTKNIDLAGQGNSKTALAFARLGLSVSDLKNKQPDELLRIISDRFQVLGGGAQATALVMEVFGRNASQLIPILKMSSSEMQTLFDKSDALGATMSGAEAAAFHDFNNSLKDFQISLRAVWVEIANEVMPAVKDFLKALQDSHIIKDMVDGFKETLRIIIDMPPVIKLAAAAVLLLSNAVGQVATVCLLLPDIIKGWGYVFAEVGILILKMGQQIARSFLGPLALTLPLIKNLQAGIDGINKAITTVAMGGKPTLIEKLYTDSVKLQKELQLVTSDVGKFAKSFQGLTFGGGAGGGAGGGVDTFFKGFQKGWKDAGDGANTAIITMGSKLTDLAKIAEDFTTQFSTNMSAAITDGIMGTKTWQEAFSDLGKQMLEMVINYFIQLGIYELLHMAQAAIGLAITTASAKFAGAEIAKAWAPAAAAASLASFGANSIPASAGLIETFGLAEALAFPRMAEGGIIRRPTLVLAGEAGPEAIVPLDRGNRGVGTKIVINMGGVTIASQGKTVDQICQDIGYNINQKLKRMS